MIWLTWRQFRAPGATMAGALAVLALILAVTGPSLADDYSSGIAACASGGGDCSNFVSGFFADNRNTFLAVTAVVLILPALIGLFWGAPLIARELDAGTHRLVWNQSVTRTRWLAVKLGLVGLATVVAAGLGSLAVDWWANPVDKAAAADGYARLEPLLFGARGIAPIGYAVFALALGVTVGMLVRRTVAAMAITLAVFVAVQFAVTELVRPNLIPPVRSTFAITADNVGTFVTGPDQRLELRGDAPDTGSWVLSSHLVDASGNSVGRIPLSTNLGLCKPGQMEPPPPLARQPGKELAPCLAEIERLGYRQQVTYQPGSRFWQLQWSEVGIYTALALGLAGFCFWWLRHRLA